MQSSATQRPDEITDGVLLRDKPSGPTSHDVVAAIRRERGGKVGHAGTLDPFATGLLLILLGRATRLQRYLVELPKTYVATARLGWKSSTGDPDGELVETGTIPASLHLPTGAIDQRPPMTSARKVDGERLYRRARRGEDVPRAAKRVHIHRAELLDHDDEHATYEIECSSGTYVRTLVETLGDAYCASLRRTAVGPFSVRDAGERAMGLEHALPFLPEHSLDASEARRVSHGGAIGLERPGSESPPSGGENAAIRLTRAGALLAVARAEDDVLKPEVVLV
ncbi:MAG: tRNA pseudouridine(55) synthase TruB [Solirubrobacterales bacterium]